MNDRSEAAAIKRVFGARCADIGVSSTKSSMGHLIAAAGAVEAAVCALAIRDGMMPVNANLVSVDADCEHLNLVRDVPRKQRIRAAMSNSFGFGGSNSCVVFRHPRGDRRAGRRRSGLSVANRALVTGAGAICAAGRSPAEIFAAVADGRSSIAPIASFDTAGFPSHLAGEIDRRRIALAAGRPQAPQVHPPHRRVRHLRRGARRCDRRRRDAMARCVGRRRCGRRDSTTASAAIVGSGGGTFDSQYDYFPLMTEAHDDLHAFGRELDGQRQPDVAAALAAQQRAVPRGHRAQPEGRERVHHAPQRQRHAGGGRGAGGDCARAKPIARWRSVTRRRSSRRTCCTTTAPACCRPMACGRSTRRATAAFSAKAPRRWCVETDEAVAERGASVLGELLGSGSASEAEGLLAISDDGEGLARAIALALDDAGIAAADVGMIVAHANGTRNSDDTEARALLRVFGDGMPPVTGFKWAFGHLLAASGHDRDGARARSAAARRRARDRRARRRSTTPARGCNVSRDAGRAALERRAGALARLRQHQHGAAGAGVNAERASALRDRQCRACAHRAPAARNAAGRPAQAVVRRRTARRRRRRRAAPRASPRASPPRKPASSCFRARPRSTRSPPPTFRSRATTTARRRSCARRPRKACCSAIGSRASDCR